jgi:hypothetical protein
VPPAPAQTVAVDGASGGAREIGLQRGVRLGGLACVRPSVRPTQHSVCVAARRHPGKSVQRSFGHVADATTCAFAGATGRGAGHRQAQVVGVAVKEAGDQALGSHPSQAGDTHSPRAEKLHANFTQVSVSIHDYGSEAW